VSVASTSTCLGGCCGGSSGLLTSTVACGGIEEVCWVVGWVGSRVRAPIPCARPSTKSSFSNLSSTKTVGANVWGEPSPTAEGYHKRPLQVGAMAPQG
jgi:hypothetical protein